MIFHLIYTDAFAWHCLIYCVLFVIAIAPIGFVNPRIMLQDYPPEIQQSVAPKTESEKRMMVFFAIPLFVIMFGYPSVVSWYYKPVDASFSYFFVTTWAMMLVFNLIDLLVIDWIVFCSITPKFIVITGTEGHPGYKNYKFHFIGFLKGIVITAVVSAILAGGIVLITKL